MTNKIVFDGDYTDLKFIKSRKVAVISVEIPIERAQAFVEAFGTPNPATGVPIAIARLQAEPAKEKPKRTWGEMPRSQQAGVACNDFSFQEYLTEKLGYTKGFAQAVYEICGVTSRTSLDTSQEAARLWDKLYGDFQMWKRGAAA